MKHCVLVGLVIAFARFAHADPKVDPAVQAKADVLFEKAQADYQSGQFQAAIELFKQAYELIHDPVYLFNVAQSYRKVLDCEAAFDYYTRYLGDSPNAENHAKVQQWLTELQPCVEQRQKEHEAAKRGEAAERARLEDEQRRERAAATPRPQTIDNGAPYRIVGISLASAGVVGLAVGVLYGVKGGNAKSDIATACTPGCDWSTAAIQQLDSDGRHDNTLAKIGYVGGGIAAVVGAGLYAFGRLRVEHVMVVPTERGAAVSAQLRF